MFFFLTMKASCRKAWLYDLKPAGFELCCGGDDHLMKGVNGTGNVFFGMIWTKTLTNHLLPVKVYGMLGHFLYFSCPLPPPRQS